MIAGGGLAGALERGALLGSFALLGDPAAAAVLAESGFDFVLVDLQHGLASADRVVAQLDAIEAAGALALVRVADRSAAGIGQALDRGARAVVVPQVDNAEQAAEAVAACRYPPHGVRSYGPTRSREQAGGPAPCLVMVESVEGVSAIDEIAAVDGLMGVFVGPTDLAVSLGLGPDYDHDDAQHEAAVIAVATACARRGVVAAIQTPSQAVARRRLSQGFRVVSVRSDKALLSSSARGLRQSLTVPG